MKVPLLGGQTGGNAEGNPMYDLNLKLGFRPTSAMLEYEKDLTRA